MGDRLVLCLACSRHIKASEGCCPFCGGIISRTSTGEPFRRMAAAAAVAAGVTTLAAACSTGSSPSTSTFYGIANPAPEDAVAPTDAPSEASDAGTGDEGEHG